MTVNVHLSLNLNKASSVALRSYTDIFCTILYCGCGRSIVQLLSCVGVAAACHQHLFSCAPAESLPLAQGGSCYRFLSLLRIWHIWHKKRDFAGVVRTGGGSPAACTFCLHVCARLTWVESTSTFNYDTVICNLFEVETIQWAHLNKNKKHNVTACTVLCCYVLLYLSKNVIKNISLKKKTVCTRLMWFCFSGGYCWDRV